MIGVTLYTADGIGRSSILQKSSLEKRISSSPNFILNRLFLSLISTIEFTRSLTALWQIVTVLDMVGARMECRIQRAIILNWFSYKFMSNSKAKFDTVGIRRVACEDVEPDSAIVTEIQKLKKNLQVLQIRLFEGERGWQFEDQKNVMRQGTEIDYLYVVTKTQLLRGLNAKYLVITF